jgi:hypothetical protein
MTSKKSWFLKYTVIGGMNIYKLMEVSRFCWLGHKNFFFFHEIGGVTFWHNSVGMSLWNSITFETGGRKEALHQSNSNSIRGLQTNEVSARTCRHVRHLRSLLWQGGHLVDREFWKNVMGYGPKIIFVQWSSIKERNCHPPPPKKM